MNTLAEISRNHHIRRVLVLGHTGFIGTHLCLYLRRELPQLEIIGRAPASLDLTKEEDARSLAELCDQTTAIVMLAAEKRQFGDNLDAYGRNMQMVVHLCRLLRDHPVARVIYFSSAAVYGEDVHNTAIAEDTGVWPTSYYGAAKFAGECLLRKVISEQPESSLLVLRPPLVFGPGDRGETYGPSGFVRKAIRGEQLTLWGPGTELREFMFVEDVTHIVARLIFHQATGIVNIASGTPHTFREAAEIAQTLGPQPIAITTRPRTKPSVDNAFRNERLLELLPGLTFTALIDGMRRTCAMDTEALRPESAGEREARA